MSGRKGMVHYRVELKQEAVRLVLEDHLTYTKVATQLAIRKRARMYSKGRRSILSPKEPFVV